MQVNVEFKEPDSKKRIKRIIVREGLIIIGCIVSFGLFSYIKNLIPYSKPSYIYIIETGGHKYMVESDQAVIYFNNIGKGNLFFDLRKKYPKEFPDRGDIVWLPDDLKISPPKTHYTLKSHIKNLLGWLGILPLIAVYPVYLFICFIIWAIKTLK